MQLKKIKLAGFKSFVDPTTMLFPSNLVAIVGPNGCGKSNIIDAISWVMGESSAKYLRGESLTDVIFNGSTARKPIGQASVELVFDNQDGSLGGEYATYAEIGIRRLITREGDSTYFLNGARCRRRDVIDIFLGTGLGPRSYSIIGQNMITRIIDAKPEEMRVYLEEAAGVSKYKERRRETENRIRHTKENLDRLNDIRMELEKQLGTLQRQANAAEKFQLLKQEERVLRSQCYGIQWRQLDARLIQSSLLIQQHETGLEAHHAELSETDRILETSREEQHTSSDYFYDIQRQYYATGNEITRTEQEINYHKERYQQWQTDLNQIEKDCLNANTHLGDTQKEIALLTTRQSQLEPESIGAREQATEIQEALVTAEQSAQAWQSRWDAFNQHVSQTTQTAQVEQTRIQHLEQKIASLKQQQIKLEQEQKQLDFVSIEQEIKILSTKLVEINRLIEIEKEQLLDARQEILTAEVTQNQLTTELNQVRNELQTLRGREASLDALQQTALGQRNNRVIEWLEKHELAKYPRLAQQIEVESGWEMAVEKVLGSYLQAVCIDNLSDITSLIDQFKEGNLCVIAANATQAVLDQSTKSLFSKIKSQSASALAPLLSPIYIADSLSDALALSASLAPHESVVTRDGVWLSASWLRISRDDHPEAGVFQREQELKQLQQKISDLTLTHTELEEHLAQNRLHLKELEQKRDQAQHTVQHHHAQQSDIQAQHKIKQERLADLKTRAERFINEQTESVEQQEQTQEELIQVRSNWQKAMAELEKQAEQRDALIIERDTAREHLQTMRHTLNQAKDRAHQLEIQLQAAKSQQESLQQTILRVQAQLATLGERKVVLEKELSATSALETLEKTLAESLERSLTLEEELNTARAAMESFNQQIRTLESKRQDVERQVTKARDALESIRMETQGFKVKSESILEQLQEAGFELDAILKELPEEVNLEEWQTQLEQVTQRIARLGPINLIAIEEYATCSERKEYLDKQNDDLQQGLATLEEAIAKIDKETRARFKETFDKVNEYFQALFPTIFGGGHSCLELTGENLLDAGITIMACPPGKRNSTIHLLSGGEKTLTAIALVFSIFQLNPAPFCLLDEVDAPLDDMNIGRFCQLVKTMAEKTQFIFISHNKLAIEMGEHLMGVTMHEPGVSRLVSVDMQEAISLAGV